MTSETHPAAKVASIVGVPGMCSDDGRALTYYFNTYFNESGGRGFYTQGSSFGSEAKAETYCEKRGHKVTSHAWT